MFVDEQVLSKRESGGQAPFPCSRASSLGLKGVFFDMLLSMDALREAYCVWGGPDCTFSAMISVLNTTQPESYKWVAGGFLFLLPQRIESKLLPSVSFLEDEIMLIGQPAKSMSALESWALIWRPFTRRGWGFIFGVAAFILALRIWPAYIFSNKVHGSRWKGTWQNTSNCNQKAG